MLISMPSNLSSRASSAAFRICSGEEVKNCATIGRSASEYFKSIRSFALPSSGARARPSAETNSVNMTSGLPYLAIIARNAASVTSAMGARTNIPRPARDKWAFNCCQKFSKIFYSPLLGQSLSTCFSRPKDSLKILRGQRKSK